MKIFLAILCLFFILFFPFWFIQFFAFIVLLVITLSFLYSRAVYYSIRISRFQDKIRAYKYQVIDIDFLIENRSILPVHYLSVFESPGKLSPVSTGKFIIALPVCSRKKVSYKVKGMNRGEYTLGPVMVKFGDPLGLFPWERRIEMACKVIIYPTVFNVTRHITNGYPGGNIKVKDKMYEDVTRLKSIREYIPGDDIRYISWKVSAHLGALYTREYLQSLHSPALLALNLALEDYPIRFRYVHLEKAVEICASLVVFFSALKQEVGLISNGLHNDIQPRIQIRGGHGHAMLLLETLAVVKGNAGQSDIINLINESHLPFPNGTRIILISPELPDHQMHALASMRRKRTILEYIPVPEKRQSSLHPKIKVFSISGLGGEVLYV
ncbi:MAG: DUF58 domain-containing protein [Spirochaetales bacterium]|nr:DUF58 domain-containing protein [Spirochaetales bacterium]